MVTQSDPHMRKVVPKWHQNGPKLPSYAQNPDPEVMHLQSILSTVSSSRETFFALKANTFDACISFSHTFDNPVKACPMKKLSCKASKPRSLEVPRRDSRSDNNCDDGTGDCIDGGDDDDCDDGGTDDTFVCISPKQ